MTGTTAAVWTFAKGLIALFAVTVLGGLMSSGKDVFNVAFSDWKVYVAAGIAAIIPVVITALNPKDTRYGFGPTKG